MQGQFDKAFKVLSLLMSCMNCQSKAALVEQTLAGEI